MPILFALALLAVMVAEQSLEAARNRAEDVEDRMRALAVSMMVYHQAANRWGALNPGVSGAVPEAELPLPSWYRKAADWAAAADGDVIATYPRTSIPTGGGRLAAAMLLKSDYDYGIGVASGGMLISSTRGALFQLPAEVPDGRPVYATRLR